MQKTISIKAFFLFVCLTLRYDSINAMKRSLNDHQVTTQTPLKKVILENKNTGFLCNECDKKFDRKDYLARHIKKVHAQEKPHKCDICPSKFSESWSLIRHQRIHTEEKPYSCALCFKEFADQGNYKKHIRIHEKEKLELLPLELRIKKAILKANITPLPTQQIDSISTEYLYFEYHPFDVAIQEHLSAPYLEWPEK
jgi:uncharacterized Zn-finger protein